MPAHSLAEQMRQRFAARNLLKSFANQRSVGVMDIVGSGRQAHIVALRVEFIRLCRSSGIGTTAICRVARRHHTTVLYHLGGGSQAKLARRVQHAI